MEKKCQGCMYIRHSAVYVLTPVIVDGTQLGNGIDQAYSYCVAGTCPDVANRAYTKLLEIIEKEN